MAWHRMNDDLISSIKNWLQMCTSFKQYSKRKINGGPFIFQITHLIQIYKYNTYSHRINSTEFNLVSFIWHEQKIRNEQKVLIVLTSIALLFLSFFFFWRKSKPFCFSQRLIIRIDTISCENVLWLTNTASYAVIIRLIQIDTTVSQHRKSNDKNWQFQQNRK